MTDMKFSIDSAHESSETIYRIFSLFELNNTTSGFINRYNFSNNIPAETSSAIFDRVYTSMRRRFIVENMVAKSVGLSKELHEQFFNEGHAT